jgi:hypothetical protein
VFLGPGNDHGALLGTGPTCEHHQLRKQHAVDNALTPARSLGQLYVIGSRSCAQLWVLCHVRRISVTLFPYLYILRSGSSRTTLDVDRDHQQARPANKTTQDLELYRHPEESHFFAGP